MITPTSHPIEWELRLREHPTTFTERFTYAFGEKLSDVTSRKFRLIQTQRIIRFQNQAEANDDLNGKALRTLEKSSFYAVREVIADSAPVVWLEHKQHFIGQFVRNTFDATDEEEIRAQRLTSPGEESFVRRIAQGEAIQFGLRPINFHPNIFAVMRIRYDKEVYGIIHVRWGFDWYGLDNDRIETTYFLPVTRQLLIGLGYSQPTGHPEESKVVARIHYWITPTMEAQIGTVIRDDVNALASLTAYF
jgi:hypothetical protein